MECPESRIMDTQSFVGFGLAGTKVDAHKTAKASCDQQAQAVANGFAALVKCAGTCKPMGSIRIVKSQETGPFEVTQGLWIDVLVITYDLIVSCVQLVVAPPPPAPLRPKTLPADIAPVTEKTNPGRRPRKPVRK